VRVVLAALALPLFAATIIGRDQIASTVYTLVLAVPTTTALAAIVVSASGSAAKVPPIEPEVAGAGPRRHTGPLNRWITWLQRLTRCGS
jgi:hypothetical protein